MEKLDIKALCIYFDKEIFFQIPKSCRIKLDYSKTAAKAFLKSVLKTLQYIGKAESNIYNILIFIW